MKVVFSTERVGPRIRTELGDEGAVDAALASVRRELLAAMEHWPSGTRFVVAANVDLQGGVGHG